MYLMDGWVEKELAWWGRLVVEGALIGYIVVYSNLSDRKCC